MNTKETFTGWHEDFDAWMSDAWEFEENYFNSQEIEPEDDEEDEDQ